MTVAELIKELKTMPQNATVTVMNDSCWVDGEYKVTYVETYDSLTVMICTDYEEKLD